jgi:DNA invertase Pin-like site-specific DNA recombinase
LAILSGDIAVGGPQGGPVMRDGLFRGSGGVDLRAAQYLRMSTDEQDYSTLNQAEAIAGYAAAHNIEVVRTYSDDARSGLQLNGRPGLKLLLSDVETGNANFDVILVYDVSRWGRFQDADESGY